MEDLCPLIIENTHVKIASSEEFLMPLQRFYETNTRAAEPRAASWLEIAKKASI
jgi:hypothetical protein